MLLMGLFSGLKDKLTSAAAPAVKGAVTEAQVLDALKVVVDPDLHRDIVSLGFVRGVEIKGDTVKIEVNLTTPACPVKEQLKAQCEEALTKLPGIAKADVHMTATTRQAPQAAGAAPANPALADVRNIIAVASGKGGVAKSTTAVNLAYALARAGSKVGLLDADVYGPSLPKMLRVTTPAAADGQVISPPEADGIKFISAGMFVDPGRAAILRGPMAGGVIKQFLTQVRWGELDYLVIDYPPGTGDIQLTISQTAPVTGAVVVTTPQEVSLIDVRKAVTMFKTLKVPILGIVETMSYFICDGCDKRHHIFRQGGGERLARELGVAFLGAIPMDPRIAVGGDEGQPFVAAQPDAPAAKAYVEAAGATARQLAILAAASGDALDSFQVVWKN
jgi:ATP-binding protein involved in chromosome partitioning